MNKQNGFTLVEFMIVIAIIGILTVLGIPCLSEAYKRKKYGKSNGADVYTMHQGTTTENSNQHKEVVNNDAIILESETVINYRTYRIVKDRLTGKRFIVSSDHITQIE